MNRMEDFGALLDEQMSRYRKGYSVGERVSGVVTQIGPDSVLVDLNAKSEGVIDRAELLDADGNLTVHVGQSVDAYVVRVESGSFRLSVSRGTGDYDRSLRDAYRSGLPVEGRVQAESKGGYEILVGSQRAFCPYSEMDFSRRDPSYFLGNAFTFVVHEVEEDSRNVVLSRRQFLVRERERRKEELQASLRVDDVLEGTVARIMPFGIFVDLGGIDGFVPVQEMAWGRRNQKPEDIVKEGDHVKVAVRELNWAEDKISLSLRFAQGDPWQTAATRLAVGQRLEGTVTKTMPFGAFVELEPGVEGLIHISALGRGRRLTHAKEAVTEGDRVAVQVEKIDFESRRIGLTMGFTETAGGPVTGEFGPGSEVKGFVDTIRDFGVFVRLENGRSGLLHIRDTDITAQDAGIRALQKKFPPDSELTLIVKKVDGDRISLIMPAKWAQTQDQVDVKEYIKQQPSTGLGSLGDAFSRIKR
jgi:small subunit ribosomal protein S1